LSKGAKSAAEEIKKTQSEIDRLKENINKRNSANETLLAGNVGTLEKRTALDNELKNISSNYDAAISELRDKMK